MAFSRWWPPYFAAFVSCVFALAAPAADKAPLHERIDRLIEAAAQGPVPPLAGDAEFLRRVSLDVVGVIPSADEARAFLADKSPHKRKRLIDNLLGGPEYPRRMRELFNVMLMERRGTSGDWDRFLEASFRANKPWDKLSREILLGEAGDQKDLKGVEFFYTKRLEKYGQNPVDQDGLTRDIGRLFLGMDLQCANCHNHLFIEDYKQDDYKGLFAFTANTALRRAGGDTLLSEGLMKKKLEFVSVFESGQKSIGPKLPGDKEVEIPTFQKGEEYLTPPDRKKRTPGVPKFSPRKILSQRLPRAENAAFRRNIANRLWWIMMGRGLVEPLDMHHAANPPSHPKLLELLAEELAATKFDVKAFLRELASSKTYQRTSLLPDGQATPPESFLVANAKALSAEQLAFSVIEAAGAKDSTSIKRDELMAAFTTAFANPPKEPEVGFRATVKAALFVCNGEQVRTLLQPANGALVGRLAKTTDAGELADELYLSVLTRLPNDEERRAVAAYLAKRSDNRPQAVNNLAWALLASSEFCVNH